MPLKKETNVLKKSLDAIFLTLCNIASLNVNDIEKPRQKTRKH